MDLPGRSEHPQHAAAVRDFFTPVAPHAENVARLVARAREGCDLLVGIHIRHGDYRRWLDGRFFYPTSDYVRIMKEARELWPGRRVRFLLCSNAQQERRLFAGLDCCWGPGHQLEDMYAFAACDYLIGPPSTYTMWASFFGEVPLFIAETPEARPTLDRFTVQ